MAISGIPAPKTKTRILRRIRDQFIGGPDSVNKRPQVGARWKAVAHTSMLVAPASILTAAAAAGVPPTTTFSFTVSDTMEEWRTVVTSQRENVSTLKRAVKKAQARSAASLFSQWSWGAPHGRALPHSNIVPNDGPGWSHRLSLPLPPPRMTLLCGGWMGERAQKTVARKSTTRRAEELLAQVEGARIKLNRLEQSAGLTGPDNWERFMQHVHVLTAVRPRPSLLQAT
jgi:hypothetical protein